MVIPLFFLPLLLLLLRTERANSGLTESRRSAICRTALAASVRFSITCKAYVAVRDLPLP